MDRTKIDLWVGVFAAIGIAALLGLAMKVGNLTTSSIGDTYTVTAGFQNIGGLKPRSPVKSAGVVVGRIDSIQFDSATYEARVTLKLDKRYQFPKDTFANIYTAGLLGEQYIGLEPGGDGSVEELHRPGCLGGRRRDLRANRARSAGRPLRSGSL